MKKKYTPVTVTFNDGVLDIYSCNSYGEKDKLLSAGHHFGVNTMGATRYFAAASAQVKVTDLIRVPMGVEVEEDNIIVINGKSYSIKQVQFIEDDNYKLLTLNKERQ